MLKEKSVIRADKKTVLSFAFVGLCAVFFSCSKNNKSVLSFEAMDTFVSVQSYGKNSAAVNQKVRERIVQIESELSVTKETSDVYRINHAENFPVTVSDDTKNVLLFSLDIAEKTSGALNPALYPVTSAWGFTKDEFRVPSENEIKTLLPLCDFKKVSVSENSVSIEKNMALDLGAVGKGFAGDEAVKLYVDEGIKSALLDLGGNIQALGKKPDGSLWNVGIKSPFTGEVCASVKICDRAVITSGGSERYFFTADSKRYIHIFDSSTGRPAESGLSSATVITERGLYGDSLSTALFVLGKEKSCDLWKKYHDFEMILITEKNEIYYTEGLSECISFYDNFSKNEMIVKESAKQ